MQKHTYRVQFRFTGAVDLGAVTWMISRILEQEKTRTRTEGYVSEVPSPGNISVEEIIAPPLSVYRGAKFLRLDSDGGRKYTLSSVGLRKWLLVGEDGCRWGDPFNSIKNLLEDLKQEDWTVTDPGSIDSGTSGRWHGPIVL